MDEQVTIERSQAVLKESGVTDNLVAVGVFFPRGHTAGGFAGGLAGAEMGGVAGDLASSIGLVGGYVAGGKVAAQSTGLPSEMFVGVSNSRVYLMEGQRAPRLVPVRLFGVLERNDLHIKVHQRVNVKVVELIDESSGARVELEGSRIPTMHVGDVLSQLKD